MFRRGLGFDNLFDVTNLHGYVGTNRSNNWKKTAKLHSVCNCVQFDVDNGRASNMMCPLCVFCLIYQEFLQFLTT